MCSSIGVICGKKEANVYLIFFLPKKNILATELKMGQNKIEIFLEDYFGSVKLKKWKNDV
jgi:hypothetical protein